MSDKSDTTNNFLSELLRRRVFRSAGAYIVVAWVAVQVGSIVFPEFGAPDWAMRALILLFIVAFPPAMLAAWTIDVSQRGFIRTPDSGYTRASGRWPSLMMLMFATAMSASALWWVWDDYIVRPRSSRPDIAEFPVIAVSAPRSLIGQSDSAWLGDGIATMIRSSLAESRYVIVLSQSRWNALTSGIVEMDEILNRARDLGVDYVVDGTLIESPSGIVLATRVEDVKNGIEIHSARSPETDAAGIIRSVQALGLSIKEKLNIPHKETVGMFEADFAVANVAAYEAYVAGLAYLIGFEYQAAERAMQAALAEAPDYHIARFRLAQVYEATGRAALAKTTLDAIPSDVALTERLQLYIEGARAYFAAERDAQKAIDVYSRLVALYPYEIEARTNLAEAYWLDFQDAAAIEEFRRLTKDHAYDPTTWMALGERLLDVGELVEAKEALDKYAAMEPRDAYAFALLGNVAQLQSDLDASVQNHEYALQLKPGFVVATIGLARSRYLQGDASAAHALWGGVVNDPEMAPGFRIDAAFELAGTLRGQGRFAEALLPLSNTMPLIEEEALRTAMALSELATMQYELGNIERAQELSDESLRIAPAPVTLYLFARGMMELKLERFDAVADVVERIRTTAENSDDTDPNAEKAANYLAGLSALAQGDLEAAAAPLQAAVDQPGYQYAIYNVGLARLHRATGDLETGAALAAAASGERDPGDLRLDLELDRALARLLHAEILADMGQMKAAQEEAQRFLEQWASAPAQRAELIRARQILASR